MLPVTVAAALVGMSVNAQPSLVLAPADPIARAVAWVLATEAVPLGLVQEEWETALTMEEEEALSDAGASVKAAAILVESVAPGACPEPPIAVEAPANYWPMAADLITRLRADAADLLERIATARRESDSHGPVAEDFACAERPEPATVTPGAVLETDLSEAEMELLRE